LPVVLPDETGREMWLGCLDESGRRARKETAMVAVADISWNIVNRTGEAFTTVAEKLRPKISKLAKFLTHFSPDALHLQVVLDRRTADKAYVVALNLRVPSDVVHVEKESQNLWTAVDECVHALSRRLQRLKARYRQDYLWKHRRAVALPTREVAFAAMPLPEHEGLQTYEQAVVEVLKQDYGRLLGFVSRRIHEYILNGDIPARALDPKDIVNRVTERALREARYKPARMDYRTWCSALAFQETRKAVRRYIEQQNLAVPVDLEVVPERTEDDALEVEEFALNLLQSRLEGEEARLADLIADTRAERPDVEVEAKEVVVMLSNLARNWPKVERETFAMHFLEGMSADDIAQAFQCPREDVEAVIARIRGRLRTLLAQTVEETRDLKPMREEVEAYSRHLAAVAASIEAETAAAAQEASTHV